MCDILARTTLPGTPAPGAPEGGETPVVPALLPGPLQPFSHCRISSLSENIYDFRENF